ncbi:MAG: right-handed parallel beta-helix repeat-containing protein, partial [bacterium]
MRNSIWFCLSLLFALLFAIPSQAQTYVAGEVSGVWTAGESPYYVLADIEIPFGQSLLIQPGVTIKFRGHYKFIAHGNLTAVGAPGDSIIFTHNLPFEEGTWGGLILENTEGIIEIAYCVIEYGHAQGPYGEPRGRGGGIHVNNCNPRIHHSRISNNKADAEGGGIYLFASDAQIFESVITNNTCHWAGSGIYVFDSNNPRIHENLILNNVSYYGAVLNYKYSAGILEANYIQYNHNQVSTEPAGIRLYNSSPLIRDNVISYNGSWLYDSCISCEFNSNPIILYNEICKNEGIAIFCNQGSSPQIENNTICWNTGFSLSASFNSLPVGRNNIIMGNGSQFYISTGGSIILTYSNIQEGWPGEGNINSSPFFVDPDSDNYNLQPYSPCIDAGDPASPLDPDGTIADMGAHYFDQSGPQGTCTIDLTPFGAPIVLPSEGGTATFGLSVINSPEYYNRFDVWYNLQQPDGQIVPLVVRQNLYLPPDGSLARDLGVTLDAAAMPGIYMLIAYVGNHPTNIESFDSFTFEKSATDGQSFTAGTVTFTDGETSETFPMQGAPIPSETKLLGHYPEPFNPQTSIVFSLANQQRVRLHIYNVAGQCVAVLLDQDLPPGEHRSIFDGSNLPSGIYIYSLQAGGYSASGKLV